MELVRYLVLYGDYRISPNKRPGAIVFVNQICPEIFLKNPENNILVGPNNFQLQYTYCSCQNQSNFTSVATNVYYFFHTNANFLDPELIQAPGAYSGKYGILDKIDIIGIIALSSWKHHG